MDVGAHLKPGSTQSRTRMLRLCVPAGSDRRYDGRKQDRVTVRFQEIRYEFGELIGRDICGDTHILVDVRDESTTASWLWDVTPTYNLQTAF